MKPVCVPCGLFYHPEKNGYLVEEGMPHGNDPLGKFQPGWKSYKLWRGDKWKCRGCENEIVVGFANRPSGEHYMPEYASVREDLIKDGRLTTFVSDC